MIPLYLLIASFIVFLLLGRGGVVYFHGWQHALRAALGAMFLLTASAHWGKRRADLIAMVPGVFPRPELLVTLTGILEIVGAAALQIPKLAFFAATGLFLMLIAVFPANIYAARHQLKIASQPVPGLLSRTVIQIIFLVALWFAGAPAQWVKVRSDGSFRDPAIFDPAGCAAQCNCSFSTRLYVLTQFTSHILPPSSENDYSKRHETGVISDQTHRTKMARPLNGS